MYQKNFKFEEYKNRLVATQIENKIIHLEEKETDVDSLKRGHNEFIKNIKLILKTQQSFKSESHDLFTEKS